MSLLATESAALTERQFEDISAWVKELCGINLRSGKKELVKSRLGKRLREGGFGSFDAYFAFVDACERMGLDLPVVPGIMPITNYRSLARFSDACGAEIPRWIRKRLEEYDYNDDSASIRAFGEDVVVELCQRLLDAGAPGLHFYTMNQAGPSSRIVRRLTR